MLAVCLSPAQTCRHENTTEYRNGLTTLYWGCDDCPARWTEYRAFAERASATPEDHSLESTRDGAPQDV